MRRNRLGRATAMIICTLLFLMVIPFAMANSGDIPSAEEGLGKWDGEIIASGTWGDIQWSLDDIGSLTVSGKGDMPEGKTPWADYSRSVEWLVVQTGITKISANAFSGFSVLFHVTLPESLTSVGYGAFDDCSYLKNVVFRGSTQQWESLEIAEKNDALTRASLQVGRLPGDFDGKTGVTDSDAMYLLRHTLFPNKYPLTTSGDVNADGKVSDSDAMYLLRHTLFPAKYPLFPKV